MNDIAFKFNRTYLALLFTAAMVGISVIVLWGWYHHSHGATTFYLGTATMKANTAVGFLVCALGLIGVWQKIPLLSATCGLLVMLLGFVSVMEYTFDLGSTLDQWLVQDIWESPYPGRMGIGTAVSFVLMGAMLAVQHFYPHKHINRYDALVAASLAIPLFVFFCYIFSPHEVQAHALLGSMPLHTCLNFLLFFASISLLTYSKGAAGLLTRDTRNAHNFRWLFFLVLILPLCLGSVLSYGVQHHWISTGIGIAIFCLFSTLIVTSALAHHTILLDHWFRQLAQERRHSHQLKHQIHELLEISDDGILLFDGDMNILHANSGAGRILGYSAKKLCTLHLEQLLPERLRLNADKIMGLYVHSARAPRNLPDRTQLLHQDGSEIPVSITFSKKEDDNQVLVIAIIKSIAKLEDQIRSLEKKASTDSLTQADNRAAFDKFCRKLNHQGLRHSDTSFCVMLIDIDNFKQLNDTHGHASGDQALIEFSQVVQDTLRDSDRLFRTGGEEFTVITPNLDREQAFAFAERIRIAVAGHRIHLDALSLTITCSIGVCVMHPGTLNITEALKRADQAMYQAKKQGKNRTVLAAADEAPDQGV